MLDDKAAGKQRIFIEAMPAGVEELKNNKKNGNNIQLSFEKEPLLESSFIVKQE